MERVKIFTRGTTNNFDQLEQIVNKWLEENAGIEIISRHATSPTQGNIEITYCTIVIFYKTKS